MFSYGTNNIIKAVLERHQRTAEIVYISVQSASLMPRLNIFNDNDKGEKS